MLKLPRWAAEVPQGVIEATQANEIASNVHITPAGPRAPVTISDLPLLVAEVEELLDIMEGMMAIQRQRRLERLRSPSWLRSNWYLVASVVPSLAFLARRICKKGYGEEAISLIVQKVSTFFRERVVDPVAAMSVPNAMVYCASRLFSPHKPPMLSFQIQRSLAWTGKLQ